jgi:flagellar basal-body rod modification protein FlgD
MAIDAYGNYTTGTAYGNSGTTTTSNEDLSVLDKDDFLTLLLVELQYQDPTEPMDSEKILSQTSQLATLESTENTNKALEDLATALSNNMQFSTISVIGKIADTGSNAVVLDDTGDIDFELYFPDDVQSGTVQILDVDGNVVSTIPIDETMESGVSSFTWDGTDESGERAASGYYYITAEYLDPDGNSHDTRVGTYPIESVLFQDGGTYLKLGSGYVALENIAEFSEG